MIEIATAKLMVYGVALLLNQDATAHCVCSPDQPSHICAIREHLLVRHRKYLSIHLFKYDKAKPKRLEYTNGSVKYKCTRGKK